MKYEYISNLCSSSKHHFTASFSLRANFQRHLKKYEASPRAVFPRPPCTSPWAPSLGLHELWGAIILSTLQVKGQTEKSQSSMHVGSRQVNGHAIPWGQSREGHGSCELGTGGGREGGSGDTNSSQLRLGCSEGLRVDFEGGQGVSDEDEAGGQQAEPWCDKKRSCGHRCQDPHRQTNAETLQKQLGARESRDGTIGPVSEFFSRGSNTQ